MKFFHELTEGLRSFTTILLDVDGTIAADQDSILDPLSVLEIEKLKPSCRIILISNGRKTKELSEVASRLGVEFFALARKPSLGLKKYLPSYDQERTVVIGDKYLTDGLWAYFLDLPFIRVARILNGQEKQLTKTVNILDDFIYLLVSFIRLFRPEQWLKNLLVFVPLIFAGQLFVMQKFWLTVLTFALFSLLAGGIYGFNDILDVSVDAIHPKKRFRPLALGALKISSALIASTLAVLVGLVGAVFYVPVVLPWLMAYFILALAYSLGLKHWPVVELGLLTGFYLLRVEAGGIATGTPISTWLFSCTAFLALLLALGKRRSELARESQRAVLKFYNERVLSWWMGIVGVVIVINYGLYLIYVHPDVPIIWLSLPLVILALRRFFALIRRDPLAAEAPEHLWLKDKLLVLLTLLWIVFLFSLLYT